MLQEVFTRHALKRRIAVSTNSPAAQICAVRSGIGLGVLSHRWASQESNLVRVLPDFEAASIDLWLVTHEDLRYSARIRAVADHISEAARRDEALSAKGLNE